LAAPASQRLIISHFYDLVALALGASSDAKALAVGRTVSAVRLAAIKADIVANLDDGNPKRDDGLEPRGVRCAICTSCFESEGVTLLRVRAPRAPGAGLSQFEKPPPFTAGDQHNRFRPRVQRLSYSTGRFAGATTRHHPRLGMASGRNKWPPRQASTFSRAHQHFAPETISSNATNAIELKRKRSEINEADP